jgi:ribonucleoside-diphosphate reductase alpha chain
MAAAITSLMTATSYRRSAELAAIVGPYAGHAKNADAHLQVMNLHSKEHRKLKPTSDSDLRVLTEATHEWTRVLRLGRESGFRNAQASVIAPTGTIGFMMDCDTTGIEPDFSLIKYKKLVGGGDMQIVNQGVPRALHNLGYDDEKVEAIVTYVREHGHVVDAPGLKTEHYEVFDCAVGDRALEPMAHVRMMAACQPFVSGAISKTVNMPETATVDDVKDIYMRAWEMGIKALAVYRDKCKVGQPLSGKKKSVEAKDPDKHVPLAHPVRKRLPQSRDSRTTSFSVGDAKGYMTAGHYDDGKVGELFLKLGKQGSTLSGFMDAFAIAVSVGLQHGVPLETYVEKFTGMEFEPKGFTGDPDVRMAKSVYDYVFKRLALDHLSADVRQQLNVLSATERKRLLDGEPLEDDDDEPVKPVVVKSPTEAVRKIAAVRVDMKICGRCGGQMRPSGSCYACPDCGTTSGCS